MLWWPLYTQTHSICVVSYSNVAFKLFGSRKNSISPPYFHIILINICAMFLFGYFQYLYVDCSVFIKNCHSSLINTLYLKRVNLKWGCCATWDFPINSIKHRKKLNNFAIMHRTLMGYLSKGNVWYFGNSLLSYH